AAAHRTAIINTDVSTLSRRSGTTVINFAIEQNPGPNSCADGGVENIAIAACRSPAGFGEGGGVGIVIYFDRYAVHFLYRRGQRKVSPTRHIGRVKDYSGLGIERTGRADSNSRNFGTARQDLLNRRQNRIQAIF